MSVEVILRNIYSYLEVLEAAHTKVVRHWSEESLQNALKWAQYCEQIHSQSAGKSYARNLDEEIRKLNARPWTLGGSHIHLALLKNAKHHLYYALLQNPSLDARLYNLVVRFFMDSGQETFIKACGSLVQPRLAICISDTVKEALRPETQLKHEQRKGDLGSAPKRMETIAISLYRYLDHVYRTVPHGPRTDAAVQRKLDQILQTPAGFEVLLRCYGYANSKFTEHKAQNSDIQTALCSHLQITLDADTTNRYIRCVPRMLLTDAAAHSVPVFSSYMRRLVAASTTISMASGSRDNMVAPQSSEGTAPLLDRWTYQEWFSHLEALRSAGGPVSHAVKRSVEELSKTRDSPVWDRAHCEILAAQT